jgi:hypothetical protein
MKPSTKTVPTKKELMTEVKATTKMERMTTQNKAGLYFQIKEISLFKAPDLASLETIGRPLIFFDIEVTSS